MMLTTMFATESASGPMAFLVKLFGGMIGTNTAGLVVAVLVIVLVGAMLGAINGTVICKANVQPFIMTIGTLTLYRGLALLLTSGLLVYMNEETSDVVEVIGTGRAVLDIPNQLYVLAIVAILIAFLLNKTVFGRSLKAIGGNQEVRQTGGYQCGLPQNFGLHHLRSLCGAGRYSGHGADYLRRPQPGQWL